MRSVRPHRPVLLHRKRPPKCLHVGVQHQRSQVLDFFPHGLLQRGDSLFHVGMNISGPVHTMETVPSSLLSSPPNAPPVALARDRVHAPSCVHSSALAPPGLHPRGAPSFPSTAAWRQYPEFPPASWLREQLHRSEPAPPRAGKDMRTPPQSDSSARCGSNASSFMSTARPSATCAFLPPVHDRISTPGHYCRSRW